MRGSTRQPLLGAGRMFSNTACCMLAQSAHGRPTAAALPKSSAYRKILPWRKHTARSIQRSLQWFDALLCPCFLSYVSLRDAGWSVNGMASRFDPNAVEQGWYAFWDVERKKHPIMDSGRRYAMVRLSCVTLLLSGAWR